MDEAVAKTELLIYYIKQRDHEAVQAMIRAGVDVNARSNDTSPVLLLAVSTLDAPMVKLLLAAGAEPNVANSVGQTPLSLAALCSNVELCKLLLGAGADPNVQFSGSTPALLDATRNAVVELVDLLLAAGADPSLCDSRGNTPLGVAVSQNSIAMCEKLLGAGAGAAREFGVRREGNAYLSPYQSAVATGKTEIAWLLFEHFREDPSQLTMQDLDLEDFVVSSEPRREMLRSMKVAHALRRGIEMSGGSPAMQVSRAGPML